MQVSFAKPSSSRNASIESFVVCQRYCPPPGFEPRQLRAVLNTAAGQQMADEGGR
jgi:hypothetical protein